MVLRRLSGLSWWHLLSNRSIMPSSDFANDKELRAMSSPYGLGKLAFRCMKEHLSHRDTVKYRWFSAPTFPHRKPLRWEERGLCRSEISSASLCHISRYNWTTPSRKTILRSLQQTQEKAGLRSSQVSFQSHQTYIHTDIHFLHNKFQAQLSTETNSWMQLYKGLSVNKQHVCTRQMCMSGCADDDNKMLEREGGG